MFNTNVIGIVFALIFGCAVAAPLETCDETSWLPPGSNPGSGDCVQYDGSLVPNCAYFLNNHTSYYHVHEYDCNKFWECSPEGPCLFECAPCGDVPVCEGYNGLTFDCRYQYPEGPVCDWPDHVNCTNHIPNPCDACEDWQTCVDGECTGCRTSDDCTAMVCSTCDDNMCVDPECCNNDDCLTGDCVDGSCPTTTTKPPGPTTTTTPPTTTTTPPTTTTTPATTTTTPTTPDPGCKTDDDCLDDQWCDTSVKPGECKPGCRTSDDCTAMSCSMCVEHQCEDPECCSNDDCPLGFFCEANACVKEGECDAQHPCDGANSICDINVTPYNDCEWCDFDNKECKPGCDTDSNCPAGEPICTGLHTCTHRDTNGVVNITIETFTCSSCAGSGNPLGKEEGGVKVILNGEYGTSCTSNGLDNLELVDYDNGKTAFFDGAPDDDGNDDGLGGCKLADLNYGLTGGSATWTGPGEWTADAFKPVCINFFDPDNNKPTCCCELKKRTLNKDETSDLKNCLCE